MTEGSKKKILLAEDDAAMRRYIEVCLKQVGYEVVATEDGLAAMEAALAGDFDAVVADAIMPQMSGYELCRMIRAGESKPFCVILSGLSENDAVASLADVFLVKGPDLKQELVEALDKLL
jgi:CheY-like chemotaxis protein